MKRNYGLSSFIKKIMTWSETTILWIKIDINKLTVLIKILLWNICQISVTHHVNYAQNRSFLHICAEMFTLRTDFLEFVIYWRIF